jgi:hypothetical protein
MQRTIRDPDVPRSATSGEVIRSVDRRSHRCVRCGLLPPVDGLFVCGRCQADPGTAFEVRNIEESFTDYREQRKALMLFGWKGGWWR